MEGRNDGRENERVTKQKIKHQNDPISTPIGGPSELKTTEVPLFSFNTKYINLILTL